MKRRTQGRKRLGSGEKGRDRDAAETGKAEGKCRGMEGKGWGIRKV